MVKSRIWKIIILYPVLLYADPLLLYAKTDFQKFDEILLAQDEEAPPPPPPAPENSNEAPAEAPEPPPPPDEAPMSEEAPPPLPPQASLPTSSSSSKRSDSGGKGKEEDDAAAAEKALRFKNPAPIPITDAERKSYCQKYNGKFLSFHSLVVYVKDCKRYELTAEEAAKKSASVDIIEVPSRVIAALNLGADYSSLVNKKKTCRDFNTSYVTYNLKIYWVDSCKLRLLPDYATVQKHRGRSEKPIAILQESEFDLFKIGEPFVSILDKEAANVVSPTIKAIPLTELCKSLRKDYVTYLDSVYKINRSKNGKTCWKEKMNSAELSRKQTVNLSSLQELNSNQAFSLPDSDLSISQK